MGRSDYAEKADTTLGTYAQDLPFQGTKALPALDSIQMRFSPQSSQLRVKR